MAESQLNSPISLQTCHGTDDYKYGSVIEADFAIAKQWFDAIKEAVGSKKRPIICACKIKSPTAWQLLKDYLNSYHVFHIGTKMIDLDIQESENPFNTSSEMITHFINLSAASHKDMARLKATVSLFKDETISLFLKQYMTKTLKIGITADTVNKAVGSSEIPVFSCMLANKYFDHPEYIVGKRVFVTEKLDGIRALAIVDPYLKSKEDSTEAWSAKVKFFSRQGQPIFGLTEIEQAIVDNMELLYSKKIFTGTFVLDGELLITERSNIPSKDQYKLTTKIVRSDTNLEKQGVTYNIFDLISKKEFEEGKSNSEYVDRRTVLERMFHAANSKAINVVPILASFQYNDYERTYKTVVGLVEKARQENKEGVMLNVGDAPYVCRRTKNLLKVKVFQDCDLEIVGFQPGTGKFQDALGALIVNYKGNKVGVGSGLSDEQRQELWNNQEKYLGRVVTIQYFEETCDANGNKSIRFPVFKELREEEKEVSYE